MFKKDKRQDLKEYLKLTAQIYKFREENSNAKDDPDEILDKMDILWYNMSWYEHRWVSAIVKKIINDESHRIEFMKKYL